MGRFHPVTGLIATHRKVWVDSRPTAEVPQPRTAQQDCSFPAPHPCHVVLSDGTPLQECPSSGICAGAGDVVAWFNNDDHCVHDWPVGRVWPPQPSGEFQGLTLDGGPTGAYALKIGGYGPWDVIEPDLDASLPIDQQYASGKRWRLSDVDVYSIQLLGHKQAIWVLGNVIHTTPGLPINLPKYDKVQGVRATLVDGIYRVLYQRWGDGALCYDGRMVGQPSPNYNYFDVLRGADNRTYFTWSPDTTDFVAISASYSDEQLATLPAADQPPAPDPGPTPPPEPKPPMPIPPKPQPKPPQPRTGFIVPPTFHVGG